MEIILIYYFYVFWILFNYYIQEDFRIFSKKKDDQLTIVEISAKIKD